MQPPIRGGAYCSTSPTGGGGTLTQVSLNTLDTAAYPYTAALSGGGLVVRGTGPIIVSVRATMSGGNQITCTLKINGSAVSPTGNTATTSNLTYVYNAARNGDILTLWETDNGGGFTATSGGIANHFIHYESPTDMAPVNTTLPRASFF